MSHLSRLRLEASGHSAAHVEFTLRRAAEIFNESAFLDAAVDGECVIERDVGEPAGSEYAWRGRLIIHPNVADDASQRQVLDLCEQQKEAGFRVTGGSFPAVSGSNG